MDSEYDISDDKIHIISDDKLYLIEKIMYLRRKCYDDCVNHRAQCEGYSYRHLIGHFLKSARNRPVVINIVTALPTIVPFEITGNFSTTVNNLSPSSLKTVTIDINDINDIQIYKFLDSELKQDTSIVNGYMYGRSVNANIPSLNSILSK